MFEDKTFYILANDFDKDFLDELICEFSRRGHKAVVAHPYDVSTKFISGKTSFYHKGILMNPALVLGWVYEDILLTGMYLLEAFRLAGIPVVNEAKVLFQGQNKYLNSAHLNHACVSHLPIFCGYSEKYIAELVDDLAFPLVIKPYVGFGGNDVRKINNLSELLEEAKSLAGRQEYFYVQPFINKPDRDIRVVCINYQYVSAVYRYSADGSWVTNVTKGGFGKTMVPTEELIALAESASKSLGALISGVDIAEDKETGEFKVLEVNTCPTEVKVNDKPADQEKFESQVADFLIDYAANTKVEKREQCYADLV